MAGKLKALLLWCQKNTSGYKDVNVVNMTTSWKDGLAFCALIHHYRPDLIDFDSLSKENIFENNQLAFQIAEKELGIAALLDADDMVSMKVPDKLSIITYVSQYYNCLHKLEPVLQSSMPAENKAAKRNATTDNNLQSEIKKTLLTPKDSNIKKSSSLMQSSQSFSICTICKKRVHLVERFIEEGKVYHRLCHRSKSLSRMYQRNSQKYQDSEKVSVTPGATSSETQISSKSNSSSSSNQPSRVKALTSAFNNSAKQTEEPHLRKELKRENDAVPQRLLASGDDNSANEEKYSSSGHAVTVEKPPLAPKSVKSTPKSDEKHESPIKSNQNNTKEMLPSLKKSLVNSKENQPIGNVESASKLSTSNSQTTNSNMIPATKIESRVSEDSSDDTLPALSLSLTESKQHQESKFVGRSASIEREVTRSYEIAPLISELPVAPEAKPRSHTITTQVPAEVKPSAKKRSINPPANSDHGPEPEPNESKPRSDSLRTGRTSSAEKDVKEAAPYNRSLNPFGEEGSEDGNSPDVQHENPFDSAALRELSGDERVRTRSVNIINARDVRLNPFTDEYEEKKHPVLSPSPLSEANESHSNPDPGLVSTTPTSSSGHTKRAAPNWKSNVEQKMQQMNEHNQTDQRYVEKTNNKFATNTEDGSTVKAPPRPSKKKTNPKSNRVAPGFGFPLVKRKVKSRMTEDEITSEMTILDVQLKDLERKGVKLEEALREEMEVGDSPDMKDKTESDKLLGEWFDLVQEKNKLVRRETDLVYLMQQQRLEQEHADIEFQIRKLMNKPETEKTEADKEEEVKLVEKLVQVVERRNTIINSIEEARLKEEEEDAAFNQVKSIHGDTSAEFASTKKKKSKIKRIFSKKKKGTKPPKTDPQSSAT